MENFNDFSPDVSEYQPSSRSSSDSDDSAKEEDPRSTKTKKDIMLSGMQEQPEETEEPRRKRKQPQKWPRNLRKQARAEGKKYVSKKGRFSTTS